jgi:MscS family membrane protein
LFNTALFASNKEVDIDLSSPRSTIYTHLYFLQENTFDPLKSASTIYGFKGAEAKKIAIKLKQILDGKGLRVNMSVLPTDANYLDTISGFEVKNRYVLFPNKMPQIYVEKINNNWYYSIETIEKVNDLYREVFPLGTELLKTSIPKVGHKMFFGIEIWQYLGVFMMLLISLILFYVLNKFVFTLLKLFEKSLVRFSHSSLNESLQNLSRPVALLLVFYVLEHYIPILQFSIDVNLLMLKGVQIAQTVFWIYVFLQFVNVVMNIYSSYALRTSSKLDDQLGPILRRILRGVVFFIGALKMLTIFGVDPTAVIAGASIGGLAVALASQDTVKNLIGTFMIFLDKPFQIGDWIEGGGLEGTVEEVGFRSSRIRAADTSIFTIPNSKLSEIVINNKGLRLYRRYNTTLGIRYDTPPELIEIFVKGVRSIVENHPDTRSDSYNVEFVGFGDSALQILLNVYFKNPGWAIEQSSKHLLHMSIVKFANEIGVGFAFPSQTIMIEEFPEKKSSDLNYAIDRNKADDVLEGILKSFPKTGN